MEGTQDKLADCLAHGDIAASQRVSNLHLGNAAARRGRGKVGEANAGYQTADCRAKDGPPNPAIARGGVGPVNQQSLKPPDAYVEGHSGQPAEAAGQDCYGQQTLPLAGHAAQQPCVESVIQFLKTCPITAIRQFLAGRRSHSTSIEAEWILMLSSAAC